MSEDISRPADIEQRIAEVQAARARVDANGQPITAQTIRTYADGVLQGVSTGPKLKLPVFTYDANGRLIAATPSTAEETP